MTTLPPTPDLTHLALKPSERLAIVEQVHQTPGLQETNYLEWKSGYDLSKRAGAAATARQLIGMANRDGARVAGHADGHAYVLIGVEPSSVPGVPQWDASDIENWLARFVGPDLRYDVHYVPHEGKDVLFLTVDAERDGDPIYCLLKDSQDPVSKKTLTAGTIYVRHGANTEPATPEDLRRLTARASAIPTTTLDLRVELDPSRISVIDPQLLTKEHRDGVLSSWRSQMRAALPKKETGPFAPLSLMRPIGESRSESEYISEVEAYVQAAKAQQHIWCGMMARQWLKAGRSILDVSVVNDSEENYENTVIELTVSLPRMCVYLESREVEEVMRLPDEPRKWGESLFHSVAPNVKLGQKEPEPEIERTGENETLVRYPELRVRPHTTHPLQALALALGPPLAGTVVPVRWRVTASNAKGDQAGEVELKVPGKSVKADDTREREAEERESAA
jgi:hypothetical protein